MGDPLAIGSISGVEIRIHRSWIFIALLIAWSFWSRFTLMDHGTGSALAMAAVAATLFFGSVLGHELAHSLEAQHRGVEVSGITLFLFGGATEMHSEVERPRDEFALTIVGPLSSLVLAATFGLVAHYSAVAGLGPVSEVAGLLGWVNLGLGIFNLLPGAPLDGGRILRSAVWAATGDRHRAVRAASRSGQALGYLIIGLGLLQLFFVQGGLIGGVWLMFIGWFLSAAAQAEIVQQELGQRLRGLTMGELVRQEALPSLDAGQDLATASELLRRQAEDALAVSRDGRVVGVLLLPDVAAVPAEQRARRSAGELALPIDAIPQVSEDTEIVDAMGDLRRARPLAVTASTPNGLETRGIVTPEQLQRVVSRTIQLRAEPESGREARPAADTHLPEGDRS